MHHVLFLLFSLHAWWLLQPPCMQAEQEKQDVVHHHAWTMKVLPHSPLA